MAAYLGQPAGRAVQAAEWRTQKIELDAHRSFRYLDKATWLKGTRDVKH